MWFRDLHRWFPVSSFFVQTATVRWLVDTIRPLSVALSRKSVELDQSRKPTDAIRLVTLLILTEKWNCVTPGAGVEF